MNRDLSDKILQACQRLYQRNMLAAADGNVSIRLDNGMILMTPSGRAKAFLSPGDLAVIDIEGKIISGQPSGERHMHLQIYRDCAKARAVVHAHPPHAIAWSTLYPEVKELPSDVLSEVILAAGRIPIVPYSRPTTSEMGENLSHFLPQHRALILERHGAVCWGESMEEAVNGMERIEHSAQILWLARQLGPLRPLPGDEVAELQKMRSEMPEKLL